MIKEKKITASAGRISYNYKEGDDPAILLIHNVTGGKAWSNNLGPGVDVTNTVIIPDLIGFGTSARSRRLEDFAFDTQASYLQKILQANELEEVIVVGHGTGGLIGNELARILSSHLKKLIHVNTYLSLNDISDDFGHISFDEYLGFHQNEIKRYTRLNTPASRQIVNHLNRLDPFSIWATYQILEKYLTGFTIDRLSQISHHYLVTRELRGKLESEKVMKQSHHPVQIIEGAVNPHIELPSEFWKRIEMILNSQ